MFSSKTLPLPTPSTYATDLHPLRLGPDSNTTSSRNGNASNDSNEAAQPLPHGPCKFILLHPTLQNQQCSCQSYHHNRITRGNICDCGHQACYHVHALPALEQAPASSLRPESEQALLERMKGLEEALKRERQNREADLRRLKELWDSDIRMLREALAPFYKTEVEMRRRLAELEDRVDRSCDEQIQLKDRLMALDEANMLFDKRMQDMEGGPKRRRLRQSNGEGDHLTNGNAAAHANGTRILSSHVEEQRPGQPSSSRALSPPTSLAPVQEHEEPRSSGILNLVDPLGPRPYTTYAPPPPPPPPRLLVPIRRRPVPHERQEPRSSGFLALDLAERQSTGNKESVGLERAASQPRAESLDKLSPPHYSHSNPDQSTGVRSPSFLSLLPPPQPPPGPPPYTSLGRLDNVDHVLARQSLSRKRKQLADHLALDVLADVSMANPLLP
ncbi:hypothetical protein DV735_g2616, partial [Chaetothyriales sp. CBS 134920]